MGRESRVKRDAPKSGLKKRRPDFYITEHRVSLQRKQSRIAALLADEKTK